MEFVAADRWLPIFDADFFTRMLDDIAHNRFSPEGMFLVFAFFGLFFLLVGAGLARKTKVVSIVDPANSNWITRRGDIVELLQTAVNQRSKVRLSFHRDDKRSRSTDAALVELSDTEMVLELASVRRLNRAWIGKLIDCDFRVKEKGKTDVFNFYHFVAEIRDIGMNAEDILTLRAAVPSRMQASQKRSSLRIDPPDRLIPVFMAWRPLAVTSGRAADVDFSTWPEPTFQFVPGSPGSEGEIVDISGGGMGLDIEFGALDDGPHKLSVTDDVYIRMELAEPEEEARMTVFVLARVMLIRDNDKKPGRNRLGLRFVRHGIPAEPKSTRLRWQTVDEEGIRDVDDWVYNRHLEIYRLRGE